MLTRRLATAAAGPSTAPLLPAIGALRGPAGVTRPPVLLRADAISEEEEAALADEAERYLRTRRYEPGHFDGVISNYRELQRPLRQWSSAARAVLSRLAAELPSEPMPVHVLDLQADGAISRCVRIYVCMWTTCLLTEEHIRYGWI